MVTAGGEERVSGQSLFKFGIRQQIVLVILVLVGCTYVLFSGAMRNSFVIWDDELYVYHNPRIMTLSAGSVLALFTKPYFASWTPLALLSHAVDYHVWHLDARGHHLTSVLLHSLNTAWVFLLTLLLVLRAAPRAQPGPGKVPPFIPESVTLPAVAASAVAALLFAIHPIRVESVAWISDRKDLLCAFFLLPATVAYLRYAGMRGLPGARSWYAVSILLFIGAVMSKSIAITLPVLLLLLDVLVLWPHPGRSQWWGLLREKLPFVGLSAVVGIIALLAAPFGQTSDFLSGLNPVERVFFPLFNAVFYVGRTVWPVDFAATYQAPDARMILFATVFFLLISAGVVVLAIRGNRYPLAAWLCYLVALLPSMGLLRSAIQPTADRYAYLPSVAFVPLLAAGLGRVFRQRLLSPVTIAATGIILILVTTLGLLSRNQVDTWSDSERLWRHAIAVSPAIPFPYYNLGLALHDRGDLVEAMRYYRKAVSLKPGYPEPHNNMGNVYQAWGDTARAMEEFELALHFKPDLAAAYVNLGSIHLARNEIDESLRLYEKAVSVDPANADALFHLAYAHSVKGDLVKALELFRRTVALDPNHQRAYVNMGVVYLREGDAASALVAFRQAARLGNPEAMQFLIERGLDW